MLSFLVQVRLQHNGDEVVPTDGGAVRARVFYHLADHDVADLDPDFLGDHPEVIARQMVFLS